MNVSLGVEIVAKFIRNYLDCEDIKAKLTYPPLAPTELKQYKIRNMCSGIRITAFPNKRIKLTLIQAEILH